MNAVNGHANGAEHRLADLRVIVGDLDPDGGHGPDEPADIEADTRTDTPHGADVRPHGADARADMPQRPPSWTAAELMTMTFPPPKWAVPGLIPEGATLLVGAPKTGKSWMALGLAVAVATGGKALGSIEVEAGPVLYLALEDTPRRLQERLSKVLGDVPWPDLLRFAIQWPPLLAGGEVLLDEWLTLNPTARMVIIDVLAKIRPAVGGGNAYEADYRAISAVKTVADRHAVAAVIVHHDRKARSGDFMSDISGTQGLGGAADAALMLRRVRGSTDGALYLTGRDVEEAGHGLRFVPESGTWVLTGEPADDFGMADTRAAIVAYLRDNPGSTPKQVADGAQLDHMLVKKTLVRMAADDQAETGARGRYYLPGTRDDP